MCLKSEYSKSGEHVAKFKYAEATSNKTQQLSRKKLKNKLNSENACYHYVQTLSSIIYKRKAQNTDMYKVFRSFLSVLNCTSRNNARIPTVWCGEKRI